MGWNLGSRFTIGHSGLVGQCAASFLDMWSHCCAEKNQQSEQCQCLQVRAEKVQVLGLLRDDQLMNLAAWLQTNKAARGYRAALLWCTYNNIALWRSPERTGKCRLCASEWGGARGALGPGCVCTAPTTARAGVWCGRGGKGWCDISKGLLYTCMLHLWLTRCESLQRGGHCLKSYYRWNVAHGGWIAVERSRRRWMYVRNMDPVWLICE